MLSLRNRVLLIGHVGGAPEVLNTESGKKRAKFSVATNEVYKNAAGERESQTQWHNLVAWGKVAEICEQFLKKGSEVALEGKLVTREYTGKDGQKKTVSEIEIGELLLLGKPE